MTRLGLGRQEAAELLEERRLEEERREAHRPGVDRRGRWSENAIVRGVLTAVVIAMIMGSASWLLAVHDAKRVVPDLAVAVNDQERRLRAAETQLKVDAEWRTNVNKRLDDILGELKARGGRR